MDETRSVTREEFEKLYKDVKGNGQPGIEQNVEKILLELAEAKGILNERSRTEDKRFKLLSLILAGFMLIVAVLTLLMGLHSIHTGELSFPLDLQHKSVLVESAKTQQNQSSTNLGEYPWQEPTKP